MTDITLLPLKDGQPLDKRYVVVPREPSHELLDAQWKAMGAIIGTPESLPSAEVIERTKARHEVANRRRYAAMLAAAPPVTGVKLPPIRHQRWMHEHFEFGQEDYRAALLAALEKGVE